ncbi:DUF3300 domain-containing protein [Azospirillum isscasi]|uniref:DUF3300 domain-containing protein n=1 Tax=Azospirillum isscasi TaxID=3053926 RepID=A0ABU0WGM4_9PROT|nr:DUF3300 domain-containing protein [Azospirillum isscasi]MDQ2103232.1 DUF3300 domain-containing protein [Azospirillum isscasi]
MPPMRPHHRVRKPLHGSALLLAAALVLAAPAACAQQAGQAPTATAAADGGAPLTAAQLQTLVGRVALYPDDLLALVLPAATQPLQIVEAQRFLDKRRADPKLTPSKNWDPSVVALLNYPDVVKLMNDDLDWTQQLGQAVVRQQEDVMAAVQTFRRAARDAGNLGSDEKRTVTTEKETIIVRSADPEVVYVPSYNPTTVVYATAPGAPPPYYYSPPYPYYYSPAATFFTGAVFGTALGYALSWNDNGIYRGDVNVNRNVNINNQNLNARVNRVSQNTENRWRANNTEIGRQEMRRTQTAVAGGGRVANAPVNSAQIRQGLSQAPGARAPDARAPAARADAPRATAGGGGFSGGAASSPRTADRRAGSVNAGSMNHVNPGNRNAFSSIDQGSLASRQSQRGHQSLSRAGGGFGGGGGGGFGGGGGRAGGGGGFRRGPRERGRTAHDTKG